MKLNGLLLLAVALLLVTILHSVRGLVIPHRLDLCWVKLLKGLVLTRELRLVVGIECPVRCSLWSIPPASSGSDVLIPAIEKVLVVIWKQVGAKG